MGITRHAGLAAEGPWLPPAPVLAVVAASCGVAVGGRFAAVARSGRALGAALAGTFAAGVLAAAAACSLPIHLSGPGEQSAGGSSGTGGGAVRIDRLQWR